MIIQAWDLGVEAGWRGVGEWVEAGYSWTSLMSTLRRTSMLAVCVVSFY